MFRKIIPALAAVLFIAGCATEVAPVEGLARIGVDLPVIERIVNHVSGSFRGIMSVYQRHHFEPEMRAAMQRWGDHVESLAKPVEPMAEAE
jgi:hypothetical protein